MSNWRTSDTAPNDEPVLISGWLNNEVGVERFYEIARCEFGDWVDEHDGEPIWEPTHWMPLPAQPDTPAVSNSDAKSE